MLTEGGWKRHDLSRHLPRLRTVFNSSADLYMFWIFLSVLGFSTVLVKLGAMSVWLSVMSSLLKVLAVMAVALLGFVAWRRLVRR